MFPRHYSARPSRGWGRFPPCRVEEMGCSLVFTRHGRVEDEGGSLFSTRHGRVEEMGGSLASTRHSQVDEEGGSLFSTWHGRPSRRRGRNGLPCRRLENFVAATSKALPQMSTGSCRGRVKTSLRPSRRRRGRQVENFVAPSRRPRRGRVEISPRTSRRPRRGLVEGLSPDK